MTRRGLAFVFVSFVALGASRCSASSEGVDAGSDAHLDVATTPESSAPDGATCGPVDVSSYQPTPLTPPNPPHAGKCTPQEISDYAQCRGAKMTSLCQEFADGQPGQACRQCIETQKTDPRWGVIVFDGSNGVYDIEGCVDDALAQVGEEKASGGSGSCGDLLYASYGCQNAACDACTASAFDACVSSAVSGVCKTYDAPIESTTGPCGALLGDAAPPDASACFPNASITDSTAQEVDWLQRIVGYMCGS